MDEKDRYHDIEFDDIITNADSLKKPEE